MFGVETLPLWTNSTSLKCHREFEQAAAFAVTWSAAVSAATNANLAATPAFGVQRPDLSWLLQALPPVWQQLQSSRRLYDLASALLKPVVDAAGAMLTQQGAGSQQETAQTAAQLLDAVCRLLAEAGIFTEVPGPVMLQVLSLLQAHPELPTLQQLHAVLSATVRAEVLHGDGRVLEAAERLAGGQQLSARDLAHLYWVVVGAAATAAVSAEPGSQHSKELLLLYWQTAVLSAAGTTTSSSVAAAVVTAVAADVHAGGDLAQQLLGSPMPPQVFAALIEAAQSQAGSAVLLQLVAHALRFQQLHLLPAARLAQLLERVLPLQTVSCADCLQLLQALLLQQGWSVGMASAQRLVERAASSTTSSSSRSFCSSTAALLQPQHCCAHCCRQAAKRAPRSSPRACFSSCSSAALPLCSTCLPAVQCWCSRSRLAGLQQPSVCWQYGSTVFCCIPAAVTRSTAGSAVGVWLLQGSCCGGSMRHSRAWRSRRQQQQAVLAGAAAAFVAAGRHTAAVQLLDGLVAAGVTAVCHAGLAQPLMEAADKSPDAEQVGCTSAWSDCTATSSAQLAGSGPQQHVCVCTLHACRRWVL